MNSLYFSNLILMDGQEAPYTGVWVNAASSRDTLFTIYCSGNGSVDFQYKVPFSNLPSDAPDYVTFHSVSGNSNGYIDPAFSTSPMNEIRAVSYGAGRFWVSATVQN
jgi:hypothetical protein